MAAPAAAVVVVIVPVGATATAAAAVILTAVVAADDAPLAHHGQQVGGQRAGRQAIGHRRRQRVRCVGLCGGAQRQANPDISRM